MESENVLREDVLIQVRDKLRKDGIKLWASPYYTETQGVSEIDVQNLSKTISVALDIPLDLCTAIIKELQANALENLKHKTRYQQSGLATLKIKVISKGKPPKMLVKELMLTCRGTDLKTYIAHDISTSIDKLKLISSGRVLTNENSLADQGVTNGQLIMAIVLVETQEECEQKEKHLQDIETVKTDSQLLALDDQYMSLEDQFGNAIKIPKAEKKSLIVAMTLHEKGRSALKKENYSLALVYLLEADEQFRNCSSDLLKSVDNYALLDLDIAWCYLCLQSLIHLPEAQARLLKCEQKFHQTYGSNFERVIAVKGSAGNEACLLMRLHLLQAIVLYHQNKRTESLSLLRSVENQLKRLKVSDESISTLMELGYTAAEARIGLRANGGDIDAAAEYINGSRQKRLESRKKALAERILLKNSKKLGKCADGKQYVDANFLKMLVGMGYNKEAARIALKMCNNVISDSIEYIRDNPLAGPSRTRSAEMISLINDLVPLVAEAGFDVRMAKIALLKHNGDVFRATDELLSNNGMVQGDLSQYEAMMEVHAEETKPVDEQKLEEERRRTEEEREQKELAFSRLKDDISMVEDDHLDMTLAQEELFFKQYLSLLEK